jgi:hypothetical protein
MVTVQEYYFSNFAIFWRGGSPTLSEKRVARPHPRPGQHADSCRTSVRRDTNTDHVCLSECGFLSRCLYIEIH